MLTRAQLARLTLADYWRTVNLRATLVRMTIQWKGDLVPKRTSADGAAAFERALDEYRDARDGHTARDAQVIIRETLERPKVPVS